MSSLTRHTSDASIEMSLPTPPIEIPMSACLKAGASFIPSPIIATFLSLDWNSLILEILSSGRQLYFKSSIPTS